MTRFVLDCDSLTIKIDEFNNLSNQLQDLSNYTSSLPSNSDEFNFKRALNSISSNMIACSKKVNNTSVFIKNVVDSHTKLQSTLLFDIKNPEKFTSENVSYKIKSGDTLNDIAARYNTTVDKIVEENDIQNPNLIYTNDKINIPTNNSNAIATAIVSGQGINSTNKKTNSDKDKKGSNASTRLNVTGDGKVIDIPNGLGSVHTYMGWQMITSPSSKQYKLREEAGMNFDKEGFGIIGDRYVIACTTTYGNVGDCVDFVQEDGSVLKCVIGDIKSQEYVPWDHNPANKWGHNDGKCIVEFVVDKNSWYNCGHANPGNSSCHPEWNKNITQAINYGNYRNYMSK